MLHAHRESIIVLIPSVPGLVVLFVFVETLQAWFKEVWSMNVLLCFADIRFNSGAFSLPAGWLSWRNTTMKTQGTLHNVRDQNLLPGWRRYFCSNCLRLSANDCSSKIHGYSASNIPLFVYCYLYVERIFSLNQYMSDKR